MICQLQRAIWTFYVWWTTNWTQNRYYESNYCIGKLHLLQSVEIHEISFEFWYHSNNLTFHVLDICANMPDMASIHKCWTFSDVIFVCNWNKRKKKKNDCKWRLCKLCIELNVIYGVAWNNETVIGISKLRWHGY